MLSHSYPEKDGYVKWITAFIFYNDKCCIHNSIMRTIWFRDCLFPDIFSSWPLRHLRLCHPGSRSFSSDGLALRPLPISFVSATHFGVFYPLGRSRIAKDTCLFAKRFKTDDNISCASGEKPFTFIISDKSFIDYWKAPHYLIYISR